MLRLPAPSRRVAGANFISLLVVAIALASSGCGGDGESKPTDPQAKVSGTVTNNGANVTTGSTVVFFCSEKNAMAAGLVDSLGKFTLNPSVGSIGIPAGRYQVMINPPNPPAPVIGSQEYQDLMSGKSKAPERAKDVPHAFGAFETSGIVLEVAAGDNKFDFDLAKLLKGASGEPIKKAP